MFMSSPLYSHICDLSSLSPPQWAFRAIRATPRCATGKISCWTLTASRPSTPRLADPTITITTITTPRVSVRTSNRAWCELSCHCGLNRREATVKLHVRHMTTNQADIFEDLFLIFNFFFWRIPTRMYRAVRSYTFASNTQQNIYFLFFCCTWQNYAMKEMNEETPEAFKRNHFAYKNPDKRFLLQKKLQKHNLWCVCSCNTCKQNIFYVTMLYPITTHMTLYANMNCNKPCTYCITLCQLFVL